MSSKILILPGDGIGVEVADQAIRVIDKLNDHGLDANYEKDLVGGASYDENGEPLTEAVLEKAKQSDAILLGAVGGSKWDNVERSKRPEAGLLGLRKELELFAKLKGKKIPKTKKDHIDKFVDNLEKNYSGVRFIILQTFDKLLPSIKKS